MSLPFYFRFEIKRQSSPNQIERSVVGNAFDLLILGKGVLTLIRENLHRLHFFFSKPNPTFSLTTNSSFISLQTPLLNRSLHCKSYYSNPSLGSLSNPSLQCKSYSNPTPIRSTRILHWETSRILLFTANPTRISSLGTLTSHGSNIGSPFEVRRSSESSHNVEGDQATPDD
ncbi:hypothetical protein QL285_041970 [Trifolium repens]|nr:hypothetical protein QL285_041970 [Trifolium repens]